MDGEHESVELTEQTVWAGASAFAEVERRLGPYLGKLQDTGNFRTSSSERVIMGQRRSESC